VDIDILFGGMMFTPVYRSMLLDPQFDGSGEVVVLRQHKAVTPFLWEM
jgi:hypothetical protein